MTYDEKIAAIAAELTNDPLGRGYSGMNDVQAFQSLTGTIDRVVSKDSMTAQEIAEAIDQAEFEALVDAKYRLVQTILSWEGSIPVGPGTVAREWMVNATTGAFPNGTTTFTNLSAAVQTTVSRAEELKLGGVVLGDVQNARGAV